MEGDEEMFLVAMNYMNVAGEFLDKFFMFRAFKMLLAFYLLIMILASILIIIQILKFSYLVTLVTGQSMPIAKGKMQKKWETSLERLKDNNAAEWKVSILEVASMLNEVLAYAGFKGETLGDKFSLLLPGQLDDLDSLVEANSLKNKIVQDPSFEISKEDAKRVVDVFGSSLKSFQAIDG